MLDTACDARRARRARPRARDARARSTAACARSPERTATRRWPDGRCCSRRCRRRSASRPPGGSSACSTRRRAFASSGAIGSPASSAERPGRCGARRRGHRGLGALRRASSISPSRRCPGTRTASASRSSAPRSRSVCRRARKIGLDVALLAQTEVGEVAEGAGRWLLRDAAEAQPGRLEWTRQAPRWCAAHASRARRGRSPESTSGRGQLAGGVGGALGRAGHDRGGRSRAGAGSRRPRGERGTHARRTSIAQGGPVVAERVALVLAERVGRTAARAVVRDASLRAVASRRTLAAELEAVDTGLTPGEIRALMDPTTYLGSSARSSTVRWHARHPDGSTGRRLVSSAATTAYAGGWRSGVRCSATRTSTARSSARHPSPRNSRTSSRATRGARSGRVRASTVARGA